MDSTLVRWLYLDLNSFFASCEQDINPHLRGQPVAIVPMMADSTSCLAASYEAKAFGVKTGTKVGDAKKMCPGLKLVKANHHLYVHYHHKLIEAVDSCIPVHAVCSIDEIACELTGSQRNVSVAENIVKKIKLALSEQVGSQIKASIGLGPNMLLAKMAADMKKPDGFTVITPADLPHKLHSLQLQDIPGVGRRMNVRLNAQNIFTMEELLKKSEQQMHAIWGGILGDRMYRVLKGEDLALPAYFHGSDLPKSIGHEHVLPPKERNLQDSLIVAQKLVSKVGVRLRQAGMMATHLHLSIRNLDGTRQEKSLRFNETQSTSFFIRQLIKMHAEINSNRPIKVSVVVSGLVLEKEHQMSLFDSVEGAEKQNKLFQVADAINKKYGRDTIYVGSLQEHRQAAPTRIAFSRIPGLDEVNESD
jgi:DNA polymerase IV